MSFALTSRERRALVALVVATVAVRLATLGAYPLMDSTESRYAEIARKMLETGNWLTPQFDYGVPFWAKPPLSSWLSAASMAVFGVDAFAARLPELAVMAGCGAIVWRLARARGGRDLALWALALFATTGLAFVAAGAVMTDPALALGTTLSMAGFWVAVEGPDARRRAGGIAFFVGIAIGLLAKGPVGVVLTAIPVGAWTMWTGRWRAVWTRLPWIGGSALAALLAVPWYWAAEVRTPGFLDYFLVGEHWKRFVEPGWKGDLYGGAHSRPRGMIWLFWIAAALPWSPLALGWLLRGAVARRDVLRAWLGDPWVAYCVLWAVAPMLFFTFAGNILPTYVLPGLPAFALLVADRWRPAPADPRPLRPAVGVALGFGALVPAAFAIGVALMPARYALELSHEALVRDYEAARGAGPGRLIYVGQRPESAQFYARGRLVKVDSAAALRPYLDDGVADFFVFREREWRELPEADRARLQPLRTYGEYRLVREPAG